MTLNREQRQPAIRNFYFDVSQSCNAACIMCDIPRTSVMLQKEPFLDFFRSNKEFFSGVKGVVIGHAAEPFLNPKLFEIIDFFTKKGCGADLVTNGNLLSEKIDEICGSDLNTLIVSVDSHIPETMESIRRGVNATQVFKSLKEISKKRRKDLVLRLNVCLMRRNIADLPGIVTLASELGVARIWLQFLVATTPEMVPESLFFCQEKSNHYMKQANEIAVKKGIELQYPMYFGEKKGKADTPRLNCHLPFDTLYMDGAGNCFACYFHSLGNINELSMEEIWNGEKMRMFRKEVNMPESPHCQNCQYCVVQSTDHMETFFPPALLQLIPKKFLYELSNDELSKARIQERISVYMERAEMEKNCRIRYQKASSLEKAGKYKESMKMFSDLLHSRKSTNKFLNAGIYFHLGQISIELGEKKEAVEYFEQCLDLEPDHKLARSVIEYCR